MARYTGPKIKLERRENISLFGTDKWKKRPTPPGQHGASKGRPTNYAIQFREKQKVKRTYGLLERQFLKTFEQAQKSKGNTGSRLLQLLELRLDNVVYRLGMAKTRMQARQFVNHGHIKVNNKKVDIPSFSCKENDEITVSHKLINSDAFKIVREDLKNYIIPLWLESYSDGGKIKTSPQRKDSDRGINEQLIIEFYSR